MSGETPPPAAAPVNADEAAVGAALDTLKTFRLSLWAPVLLGCIMLFDSWDSIAIAYVMPALVKEWGLNPAGVGAVISAGYMGQFIGAIILGAMAERLGRAPVFVFAVVAMGLLAIGQAYCPNYELLLGLRFVQGIFIGGALPVSITYINELAPTATRGRYFAIFQFICMGGYAASSLSSTWIIPHLGWRWQFGAGALPLILLPLAMATLPESPRWLARTGRLEQANKALVKLGGRPVIDTAAARPVAAAEKFTPVPMSALFGGVYRQRTTIIILLWFLTAFTNFGLTTWVPSIYATVFKIPVPQALLYSSLAALLFLVVTPIMGLFTDRIGRRPLAMIGSSVATLALAALAIHPPTSTAALVANTVTGQLSISLCTLMLWPYTAENYPTPMRAVALGVCSSTARAASMLTPLFVGFILASGGSIKVVFGVFGAFAAAVLLIWIKGTRETARINLESV